jgi:hypothetical protein
MHVGVAHKKALSNNLPPSLQADTPLQSHCSNFLLASIGNNTLDKYKPAWTAFTIWLRRYQMSIAFSHIQFRILDSLSQVVFVCSMKLMIDRT